MTSVKDSFPPNYLHRTNVHTPQGIEFSQMIVDLLLVHSKQTDCIKLIIKKRLQVQGYKVCDEVFKGGERGK